jgi:putative ABC transport system substrate-binding protein
VFLNPATKASFEPLYDAFLAGLKEHGYVEGRDIAIEQRWAEDRTDRLPAMAAEAVAMKPAVIVTATSSGIEAVRKATSSIPIVFATGFNPVEQGFVESLRRPGGNVTGVIVHSDLAGKMVEVAREALPSAKRLAILIHQPDPAYRFSLESFEPAVRRFAFEPIVVRVTRIEELDRAFAEIADRRAEALYVPELAFMYSHQKELIQRALKAKLPLLTGYQEAATAGALLSYGTLREENYRRAAALVDKILRGAKPAELPVEQPERFMLVVIRRTARAIGVELSPVTMLRANRIVD